MTEIWETLPASPCSASSGDSLTKGTSQHPEMLMKTSQFTHTDDKNSSPPLSPSFNRRFSQSSLPLPKRARFESNGQARSVETTVESVEARSELSFHCDAASKVDASPGKDVRRRKLMERLRDIDRKKAMLKCNPLDYLEASSVPPLNMVDPESSRECLHEEEVTFVQESRTATRKGGSSRRRSSRTKSFTQSPNAVIDVDEDERLCSSIDGRKSPRSPCYDEPVKRTSSRIRKPRVLDGCKSPSVALEKTKPMPTCMSKCKRLQFCKKLINTMLRDKKTLPFSAPVNELWHEQSIPRYYEVISHPMDLSTIKRNLETCMFIKAVKGDNLPYRFDVDKFANEVRLVFRNAMVYNRAGDSLHTTAQTLMEDFDRTLVEQLPVLPLYQENVSKTQKSPSITNRKSKGSSTAKKGRVNLKENVVTHPMASSPPRGRPKGAKAQSSLSSGNRHVSETEHDLMSKDELKERLSYLQRCRVPVIARTPLPKGAGYLTRAALLYDIEMSYEQKKKCSQYVTKVPENKLGVLIEMINKNGRNAVQGDELDMDALDNQTLRNMEAFFEHVIPGFKTVRTSTLGREFSNVSQVDDEIVLVKSKLNEFRKEDDHVDMEPKTTPSKEVKSFFESGEGHDSSDSSSGSDSDDVSDSSDDSGSESD